MADGLGEPQGHAPQIGQRFPGEIAAQLAGANANKWETGFGHEVRFRPALIAEIEYLCVIDCLQRFSDGQGRIDVAAGPAAGDQYPHSLFFLKIWDECCSAKY